MTVNAKLRKLVELATNSNYLNRRINELENQSTPEGEAKINTILENLREIKDLVPLIEGDIKALSSL